MIKVHDYPPVIIPSLAENDLFNTPMILRLNNEFKEEMTGMFAHAKYSLACQTFSFIIASNNHRNNMSKNLGQLKKGQKATIENLPANGNVQLLLTALGILPGDQIEVLGLSPFGGPISVSLGGNYSFAIRRDQARDILVKTH